MQRVRELGEIMRCQVTIVTIADGSKTRFVREGVLLVTPTEVALSYTEENAETTLVLRDGKITMVRKGDYTLSLQFEKGKTLDGSLGLGGNVGGIKVKTDRIGYSVTEKNLTVRLKYQLLMDGEPQKMQVSIDAKGE